MIKETTDGLLIKIRIVPNSSKNEIILEDGFAKIKITAQPIENKANKALIEFLSKTFKIAKSNIEIVTHPINVTAIVNENVTFTVKTTGNIRSYQWQYARKGSTNWSNTTMEGATTDTLTIPATLEKSGRYYRGGITNTYSGTVTTRYV